jgi:hypothetical protein
MNLSRSLLAVAALSFSACTPDQQSVLITGLFPPPLVDDGVCTVTKPSVAQTRGSLNTAFTRSYLMIMTLDSLFVDNEITPSGNIVIFNQIEYTYTTTPGPTGVPVGFPSTETRALTFEVKPETQDTLLLEDLIGPQAAISLDAVPASSPNDYFTLNTQVRLRGTLVSGGAVQTNRVSFPIAIYNSGAGCPAGYIVSPEAPCGNVGQDGVSCCEQDTSSTVPKCKG